MYQQRCFRRGFCGALVYDIATRSGGAFLLPVELFGSVMELGRLVTVFGSITETMPFRDYLDKYVRALGRKVDL